MTSQSPAPSTPPKDSTPTSAITPELVTKVAERVYAMLLADLRIEAERWKRPSRNQGER